MNLVACIPWKRAYDHAEAAIHGDRGLNTIAMLIFTSFPVVAAYAWAFSATWLLGTSLTALFLITVADLNPDLVATYLFDVPPWLCERGFRRSIVTKDDGSCFFDSVRIALGITEQEVRVAIADWIDQHHGDGDVQATFVSQSKNWGSYTEEIRKGNLNLWADTLEALAVARYYKVTVQLHAENATTQTFGTGERAVDLYFTASSVNGRANHYRLLRRSFLDDWMRF